MPHLPLANLTASISLSQQSILFTRTHQLALPRSMCSPGRKTGVRSRPAPSLASAGHHPRFSAVLRLNCITSYPPAMAVRIAIVALFLSVVSTAQNTSSSLQPPLPVIERDACGSNLGELIIEARDQLRSTWHTSSKVIAILHPGEKVAILSALFVTREPDIVELTKDRTDPPLRKGERGFRYGFDRDGDWHLWTNGVWWRDSYENTIELGSRCGFSDQTECDVKVIKNGVQEWWLQVKTENQKSGWMLASSVKHNTRWYDPNAGLGCMD